MISNLLDNLNWLAALAGGAAYYVIGAAWYGILGKGWMEAAGLTAEQILQDSKVYEEKNEEEPPKAEVLTITNNSGTA